MTSEGLSFRGTQAQDECMPIGKKSSKEDKRPALDEQEVSEKNLNGRKTLCGKRDHQLERNTGILPEYIGMQHGDRLFPAVSSDRAKGNGHKLE